MNKFLSLYFLFAFLLWFAPAEALEPKTLKIVGANGDVLILDASTVISSYIEGQDPNSSVITKEYPYYRIVVVLTKTAAETLGMLTRASVGKKIRIILGERLISDPNVAEPIMGERAVIMVGTKSDATEILAAMRNQKI